jgi:hypothetical protein
MNRCAVVTGLGAVLAAPLVADAQPRRKPPRVTSVTTTLPENSTSADAFRQRLADLGYVEGQMMCRGGLLAIAIAQDRRIC